MALKITLKDVEFGVGDRVRVIQKIKEVDTSSGSGKSREAIFEGMVIAIRGKAPGKTFIVRRIGRQESGLSAYSLLIYQQSIRL